MGYRNYLFVADKKKLNKIRKMTREELFSLVGETPSNDGYYPYYRDVLSKADGEQAFELGKYVDFTERLKPFLRPLFRDKKIHEYYNEESECFLAKPEILQEIATIYREKVQNFYKDLLEEKSKDEFDTRTQLERLISSVQSSLLWSQYLDRLSEGKYSLGGGWLYEHEVFNILYLMKIINPKKQCLIYVGS